MVLRPRQSLAAATVALALAFAVWYVRYIASSVIDTDIGLASIAALVLKTFVELVASVYGIAFVLSAFAFVLMRDDRDTRPRRPLATRPPVGIVYLCCDDADWDALESLATLSYPGPLSLVIHDDSRDERARALVDRMAEELRRLRRWHVHVLRRPERSGGKAGAVNYALEQTAHLYEYFLICDNDTVVLEPSTIESALERMDDASVGIVQCRSVPTDDPGYCVTNRRLAESIAAFHAFLAPAARFGWLPFIGHNAVVRTSAIQEVGGLTPDFFSDDLDLTVRLNLAGYRVAYAADIPVGEKHPPSYTAFRKRSYKWAYGCVQTLRAHWKTVLTSPRFSFAEKVGFFQFAGFYCLQCVLLVYLAFALLVVPFLATAPPDPAIAVALGLVLIVMVYAPMLAFYIRTPGSRRRGWLTTLTLCGLVYGGTDFSVFHGVTDAVRRRKRAWIPTNGVVATAVDPGLLAESIFGVALLAVPIVYFPELLYLPCWFLFAGKFLFGPALSLLYRDDHHDAFAARAATSRLPLPDRAALVAGDRIRADHVIRA
jgi:1,2-diacylglycerol 3-beta-glucosyltransferase